jgi:carboxyl-terminal processing protease
MRMAGTVGLVLLATAVGRLPAQQTSAYEELQAFSGVLNYIRLNYPDTVSYSRLVHAAIDGVLHALDPHSAFFTRQEFERRTALERGELAVTGLALEEVDSAITVLAVAARGPAAKAGVQPGDRLVSVNDTSVAGLEVHSVELRLVGDRGSKVRLQFERGSRLEPDTFGVTIKRDFIALHSVSLVRMVDSVTGYVRLDEVRAGTCAARSSTCGEIPEGTSCRRSTWRRSSSPAVRSCSGRAAGSATWIPRSRRRAMGRMRHCRSSS